MPGLSAIDREFKPLPEIKDHHPKYVLTRNDFSLYKEIITYLCPYLKGIK